MQRSCHVASYYYYYYLLLHKKYLFLYFTPFSSSRVKYLPHRFQTQFGLPLHIGIGIRRTSRNSCTVYGMYRSLLMLYRTNYLLSLSLSRERESTFYRGIFIPLFFVYQSIIMYYFVSHNKKSEQINYYNIVNRTTNKTITTTLPTNRSSSSILQILQPINIPL